MSKPVELRWIQTGVFAGICASVLYPVLLFAPLPLVATVTAAACLGPVIGVASLGLFQLINLQGKSVLAAIAAVSNFVAGGLFTAMVLVQLAVKQHAPDSPIEPGIVAVWLGLDVAWDIYIGIGTVLFAWSMLKHIRFRWPFAVPGLVIGVLVVALNIYSFPTPPAEAGSIDVGPLVGFWYLVVTVQTWRSYSWAKERIETNTA